MILRIIPPSPSNPPTRSQSKHAKDPAPPPPSPPISRSWRLGPSSFEDKKIRSPSPSPEGLGGFGLGEEKQQYRVKEEWDVRGTVSDGGGNAEKVGKAYVATGLDWGFNHSSEDLAMACTNGAIVVWQLQPSGVVLCLSFFFNQGDQVKFEHTKAINKVVFGGEQGHWLISGSQDGYLKLWDIREGRPSRMILNSLSDPVRDLALSPVPGEVYAIASVHDSGSLVRWDLRKPGMNYSSIAHLGSGLCVDWTHGYDEETKSWVDWVASGGQDRKIKGESTVTEAQNLMEGTKTITGTLLFIETRSFLAVVLVVSFLIRGISAEFGLVVVKPKHSRGSRAISLVHHQLHMISLKLLKQIQIVEETSSRSLALLAQPRRTPSTSWRSPHSFRHRGKREFDPSHIPRISRDRRERRDSADSAWGKRKGSGGAGLRWEIQVKRLAELLRFYFEGRLRDYLKGANLDGLELSDERNMDAMVQVALEHLHVFRPASLPQLTATLVHPTPQHMVQPMSEAHWALTAQIVTSPITRRAKVEVEGDGEQLEACFRASVNPGRERFEIVISDRDVGAFECGS
ncbi:hypothetical protein BT69DRAFT_1293810 [Atractiella rhizophila]|nr:hypothetical protein BT69DRAFT_1293810 [Atractiella rhizophila]